MANPRMTAEIGRVLGGRYRLVAPIGMGASAQVYLADDVKLRRRVALKMLHDGLAGDTEFLRRFRAEARAAAALSHPNVMAVYDWSDGAGDDESAFIVTEYLPGGSLRSLLDAGSLLTPSQALGVGLEAARALDYAHRRGFVHRDIKPANLLFGEEQRLRIADFGLARALAEAAWTEPQGAVLGTARYASPEQAKGETLSGKADVYSLTLALIESVTGTVPFVADTTLGTLMARVDRELEVPDELGPLKPVLEGAGHHDPTARTDARGLATGLLRAAKQLSRPAPLPLVGAVEAGAADVPDLDPTVHAPVEEAAALVANDLTEDDLELEPPSWVNQADPAGRPPLIAGVPLEGEVGEPDVAADPVSDGEPDTPEPVGASTPDDEHEETDDTEAEPGDPVATDEADRREDTAEAAAVVVPSGDGDEGDGGSTADDDGDGDARPGRRRWPYVAAVLVLVAALGIGAVVATNQDPATAEPPLTLPVPFLVGRTEADATALATAGGWSVEVVRERRDDTVKGEVLETSPAAGSRLAVDRSITLTVSEGQTLVDVPTDLVGLSLEEATARLAEVGLGIEVVDEGFSEDVPADDVTTVAADTPARLEKGSTVKVAISKGPEPRTVPSGLVGSTEAAAIEALEAIGLEPVPVRSFSDSVAEGLVISVLPRSGTSVPRGETVNVEISRGPELVAVPSVAGAGSTAEAVSILQAAGLAAGNVSGPASGSPQGTSPGAGSLVAPGSTVDIILG